MAPRICDHLPNRLAELEREFWEPAYFSLEGCSMVRFPLAKRYRWFGSFLMSMGSCPVPDLEIEALVVVSYAVVPLLGGCSISGFDFGIDELLGCSSKSNDVYPPT